MTRFEDGPAKGQCLMLKRAPFFLRVVECGGNWDALDQTDDEPKREEKIYAYRLMEQPGMCHVNRGRGGSGFYTIAKYGAVENQPPDEAMRTKAGWVAWCESQTQGIRDWTGWKQ